MLKIAAVMLAASAFGVTVEGAAKDLDQAQAQTQTALLAASCTGCHGSATSARRGNALPVLHGRRAGKLERYLLEYKSGKRKGTLMPRLARGYTDAQLTELARYFSTAKE